MISTIRQFHDSMQASVRLENRMCSRWFVGDQGLRQGCVLALLLFNVFFVAVINLASRVSRRTKASWTLWYTRGRKGGRGSGRKQLPDNQSSRRRIGVCFMLTMPGSSRNHRAAFVFTVSEAKTEVVCLRAKGMSESTATFSVEAADQVYNQTNEFGYLGGNVNHNANLPIEVDRRMRNAWCSFRKYALELYNRPSAPPELKMRMLRAEVLDTMLYGCVTWSPRACHYDTLRRAHHSFLTRSIGWRKHNCADQLISYLDTLIRREVRAL